MSSPEIAQTVDVGGVRTNIHDLGSGRPVLLIHGSGPGVTAWANWRLTMPALAERMRVLAPDMLGFGYTDRPEDNVYSMPRWVEHLIGLADALGLQDFDVVGNSFGGGLALATAIAHPKRVRRLVLMGSMGVSFPITDELDKVWGYEPSPEAMEELLRIFAYDQSLVSGDLAKLRYEASIRPGFQESFSAMFPAPRQSSVEGMASPEAEIAKITCPTLIIHGREDRVIPPSNAERLFKLLKHAQLHMFGECGHWTQIEHAERFNRLVRDFLSEEDA